MSKLTKVISFGMNNRIYWGQTQEQMLSLAMEQIAAVRGYHPDLICLPELFLESTGDRANPNWEQLSSSALSALQQQAQEMHCWIAASLYERVPEYPDMRYITLYLLNRNGEIAAKYRKYHTVIQETTVHHALPGNEPYTIVDTDFGRVGLLICFDIGWRKPWDEMGEKGVEMVIWASAYNGGSLLNMHALHNNYFVVSTVQPDHPKVINKIGRTIAEGTRWNPICIADIDLQTAIFHTDNNAAKINSIRAKLGDRVTIETYSEENLFTLSSTDPDWPISRICEEFSMLTYQQYHDEATQFQIQMREQYPTK